jgi:hypothetical protein
MNGAEIVVGRATRPLPARWITGTFTGWSIGFVLAIMLIVAAESVGLRETQFPLALGMGIGVGYVQAGLLLPYLARRGAWVAATTLGLAAPFLAADVARVIGNPLPYSLPAYVGLGGLFVGFLQWRLLRRLSDRASLWLAASPVGWMLGGSTVAVSDLLFRAFRGAPAGWGPIGALLYIAVVLGGGVLLGAVGAAALRRILPADDAPAHGFAA